MISKKIIPMSLVVAAILNANEIQLDTIGVESTMITEVSQNAQVSADLASALSSSVPSIDMSRRSGIANDIFIRGQKRDNISVEVDGTKVHGACPNRMDPPVSHIVTNQIQNIEIIEGPYDVETFGTLSGGLKITTKKPTKELKGDVDFGVGNWGYRKMGTSISGGDDKVRVLVNASNESSGQYEDGSGNTIAEQTDKASVAANKYQTKYKNLDAYTKKSVMSKMFINVAENQELRLSYTGNRSDNVLYANSSMDARYDNSNIYSIEYDIKNINPLYKNLNIQYYYSDVDHPMDTKNRVSGATAYMTAQLKTSMQGVKLKNSFDMDSYKLVVGLDSSRRTWEGDKFSTTVATGVIGVPSIMLSPTQTDNKAIFAKVQKGFGDLNVEVGARYDSTDITPDDATKQSNSYSALGANILATYNTNKDGKLFLGLGQASRVPDARELYLVTSGTPNLKQTTNKEVDFGYELKNEFARLKAKGFYSMLNDYIYIKKGVATNAFSNIDATIYGAELSASLYPTDKITINMGASYKVGKKDEALPGQHDKDLADIAPIRGTLGVNYEYAHNSSATIETRASGKWSKIDSDNGEQELKSWAIVNLKVKHQIDKNVELTVGVNNLFNETYASSNTYTDLTLVAAGAETMLFNDPGRYVYTNLRFKF